MQINKENLIKLEEKIINFWKANNIFEKTLEKNKNNKRFVFVEGPPYANDKPHIGHFLTRVYKDIILRFRTMIGEYAERKAGWDTHGLPIEVATEKFLEIKNKKDIYQYGIENFNKKCKELVMKYKNIWEYMDERMGFWIDHQNAYITYDPFYMESCWWIIKKIYEQGFLKEEYKVFPYCPRCETVLSQAEVGQIDAYKKVLDPDVYVKFKLKKLNEELKEFENKNVYLLVWTTTPWTLISNTALAIKPELEYKIFEYENEFLISLRLPKDFQGNVVKVIKGESLIGLEYEPLYETINLEDNENSYKIYPADFVKEDEGTGIVHIAPAFGEEDFELSKKYNLPLINPIDETGKFNFDEPAYISSKIKDLFFKEADPFIVEDLKNRNLIFYANLKGYEHEYPHCWRCKSPLIYYLTKNWVIKVSKFKDKLLKINQKINWYPPEIGKGRFYEWLKEGKDWNLSRTRVWGIPLPIWVCNKCKSLEVIGSLKELAKHFRSNNKYILLRHGEAVSNVKNLLSSYPEVFFNPLTEKGIKQIKNILNELKKKNIDLIITSPLLRARQTANIIKEYLNIPVFVNYDLREIDFGVLNGKSIKEYEKLYKDQYDQYFKKPEGGESLDDVRKRMIKVIIDLEKKYEGKTILIISHQDPLWALMGEMQGFSQRQTAENEEFNLKTGEFKEIEFLVLPRNEDGEIDLHRPYVDRLKWKCKCGGEKERIEDLADIWFDSGSVPFASVHYPFENKKEIDEGILFPVDFIVEGVDQTRGWFYTLLVIGYLVKKMEAYRNVISLGLVLDKEGRKMSKSLGNVVDPLEAIEKYGADLLRFFFVYISEPADNKRFNEEELLNIKRNYFDLILNIYSFYRMYYSHSKNKIKNINSNNLLDKWFDIRLKQSYKIVYENLYNFNITKASRELMNLVQDLSHWWLRRSRRRFQKPKSELEKIIALLKLEEYLYKIAILSAPINPFFSEFLYQELKDEVKNRFNPKLSVHLEQLSPPKEISTKEKQILEKMNKIREITSAALALRKRANIKVRQPLSELYIGEKIEKEFLDIIQEEINVKKIIIGEPKNKENYIYTEEPIYIWLNINITPELKEEGIVNDLIRNIQDLRQDLGLIPSQKINFAIVGPNNIKKIVKENRDRIIKECNLVSIKYAKPAKFKIEREFEYENFGNIILYLY
mgnify:CR=1 FL=1